MTLSSPRENGANLNVESTMDMQLDRFVDAYKGETPFDVDNEVMLKWYSQRIVKLSEGKQSCLELGLGHGYTTNLFSTSFSKHIVLEGSEAVIANYWRMNPNSRSEVIETYFENFETDDTFDVIVLGFILEHVDDPDLILRRFRKFLAPGGMLFASVPNAEALNRRLGHLAGMLPDIETLSAYDHQLGHQRYYTVASLSESLEAAGYKIEHMEGIYLKPLTSAQMNSLGLVPAIFTALCQVGLNYPELSCGLLAQAGLAE